MDIENGGYICTLKQSSQFRVRQQELASKRVIDTSTFSSALGPRFQFRRPWFIESGRGRRGQGRTRRKSDHVFLQDGKRGDRRRSARGLWRYRRGSRCRGRRRL